MSAVGGPLFEQKRTERLQREGHPITQNSIGKLGSGISQTSGL